MLCIYPLYLPQRRECTAHSVEADSFHSQRGGDYYSIGSRQQIRVSEKKKKDL